MQPVHKCFETGTAHGKLTIYCFTRSVGVQIMCSQKRSKVPHSQLLTICIERLGGKSRFLLQGPLNIPSQDINSRTNLLFIKFGLMLNKYAQFQVATKGKVQLKIRQNSLIIVLGQQMVTWLACSCMVTYFSFLRVIIQ